MLYLCEYRAYFIADTNKLKNLKILHLINILN